MALRLGPQEAERLSACPDAPAGNQLRARWGYWARPVPRCGPGAVRVFPPEPPGTGDTLHTPQALPQLQLQLCVQICEDQADGLIMLFSKRNFLKYLRFFHVT